MSHGKILVTGDQGYIGSVLVPLLLGHGYQVVGMDAGFYTDCLLDSANATYVRHKADIRDVDAKVFDGVEAVIHLAALSNDALGEFNTSLTDEINRDATVRLARLAKSQGVHRFVFASSQSMYGVAATDSELDEDGSEKKPLTAYGRTKWEAECEIKKLADADFTVVCFRPSTVFGVSPRLRCDVVYNNLVACAYTTGRIEIKSDGTPWRPVIHVRDVCSAFLAGLEAPTSLVNGRSYNVGIPDGNFTVGQLAEAAQGVVPGSKLVYTGEHNKDVRTYRVSFQRILTELHEYYRPEWDLQRGGRELVDFFQTVGFAEKHFRGRKCNRLDQLRYLQESKRLDPSLRYLSP